MAVREKLGKRLRKSGLNPSPAVVSRLEAYFELLQKWNKKISLTALPVDEAAEEAIDRLIVEPLLAAKHLPSSAAVIDIGSGGGSPAVPMKIFCPGISMRMVESKTRKAAFLREVVRTLDLDKTFVETSRFEELLARPNLHEASDVVTIRAVRTERKTLMALQAFLRPGGRIFLFRSSSMGGEAELVTHPLVWEGNHILLPHLSSQLTIFRREA